MGWAVSDGKNIVMRRDVTVHGQVVWIVDVAGVPDPGLMDHANSGLCKEDKRNRFSTFLSSKHSFRTNTQKGHTVEHVMSQV